MIVFKKIAVLIFIITIAYIPSRVTTAEAPSSTKTEYTKEELVDMAYTYANKYGVNGDYMVRLIDCENRSWNPLQQSNLKYNFSDPKRGIVYGEREKSFGLSQIHLPDHPTVSYEEATDPDFSLDFMAKHLANGQNIWYCKNII